MAVGVYACADVPLPLLISAHGAVYAEGSNHVLI